MALLGSIVVTLLVAILVELFCIRSDLRKAQERNFAEIYEIQKNTVSSAFYLEKILNQLDK